eukprot:gene40592-49489_t
MMFHASSISRKKEEGQQKDPPSQVRAMVHPSALRPSMQQTLMLHSSAVKSVNHGVTMRMAHPSALNKERPASEVAVPMQLDERSENTASQPVVYTDFERNLDVCPACYNKFSKTMVQRLQLRAVRSWQERGFASHEVRCDACSEMCAQQTKLSVATMLRGKMAVKDIAAACQAFKLGVQGNLETGTLHTACQAELTAAGFSREEAAELEAVALARGKEGRLDVSRIDLRAAVHLVRAEEQLRLTDEVQALYRESRDSERYRAQRLAGWLLEDDIQKHMLRLHGLSEPSDQDLQDYRARLAQFYEEPSFRAAAFFLRLNIVREPPAPGSALPEQAQLLLVQSEQATTLGALLDRAAALGRRLLSDEAYAAFLRRHRSRVFALGVYILEAHFVERDARSGR